MRDDVRQATTDDVPELVRLRREMFRAAARAGAAGRPDVTAAIAWLDGQGADIVDLHATPQAERLYRSVGFSEPSSLAMRRLREPGGGDPVLPRENAGPVG